MAGSTIGTAYVQIMPSFEGATEKITESIVPGSTKAGEQAGTSIKDALMGKLQGLGGDLMGSFGEVGTSMTEAIAAAWSGAGGAAIVTAVAAVAAACIYELEQIGAEFDEMNDTIILGTGASGDALAELEENARNIATTVPTSFATAGDIIQDFNTRLGLTGDELEEVGSHAAKLNEITGGLNYDQMAVMFNVWQTSAEDMTAQMDYLWGVSQATGIGMDQLTGILETNGGSLQSLGFSFEEAANMAGLLDKYTGDASGTMGKMSKALVSLSEPGEDVQDTFKRTVGEMEEFIKAGDEASALDLAGQVFGTRGAAGFINALETGKISLDAIGDSALGAAGDIEATIEATESWPQQWELIKNNVKAALEPLASGVFEAAGTGLEWLSSGFSVVNEAAEPLKSTLREFADDYLSRVKQALEPLRQPLSDLGSAILPALSGAFSLLSSVLGGVFQALAVVWDILQPVVSLIAGILGVAIEGVANQLTWLGQVMEFVAQLFQISVDAISAAWAPVGEFFGGIASTISNAFSTAVSFIKDRFGEASSSAQSTFQSIVDFVSGIPDRIIGFFSNLGSRITSAIGSIHFPQPDVWWEDVKIGPASFPIPHISWYAKGALFMPNNPVVWNGRGFGDNTRYAEMAMPLSPTVLAGVGEGIAQASGGFGGVNVYINNAQVNSDEAISASVYNVLNVLQRKGRM